MTHDRRPIFLFVIEVAISGWALLLEAGLVLSFVNGLGMSERAAVLVAVLAPAVVLWVVRPDFRS